MGSWTSLPWGMVGVRELSGNVGGWAGPGGCSQLGLGPLGEGVGEIQRVVDGAVGVGHPAESVAAAVQRLPGGRGCGRPLVCPGMRREIMGEPCSLLSSPSSTPVPPWRQTDWGGILVLPQSSRVDAGPDSGAPSSHLRRGNCEHRPTAPGAGWTLGNQGRAQAWRVFLEAHLPPALQSAGGMAMPSHLFARGRGGLHPEAPVCLAHARSLEHSPQTRPWLCGLHRAASFALDRLPQRGGACLPSGGAAGSQVARCACVHVCACARVWPEQQTQVHSPLVCWEEMGVTSGKPERPQVCPCVFSDTGLPPPPRAHAHSPSHLLWGAPPPFTACPHSSRVKPLTCSLGGW